MYRYLALFANNIIRCIFEMHGHIKFAFILVMNELFQVLFMRSECICASDSRYEMSNSL